MTQSDGTEADEGHYFFFSAPASPVHYILHSPPSSTAPAAAVDGDCCGNHGAGAGDFEFFAARAGGMSSAEELFVAGRIRVGGGLSPIRQEELAGREDQDSGDDDEVERDGRAPRSRRARSASPPRSPRAATGAEPSPHSFASASSSSSSSSSSLSSSSAKNTRRRISLRDLLTGTGSGDSGAEQGADTAGGDGGIRSGFWPPSIWPSRSKKALPPCPAPLPGRRSTSSVRAAAPAKKVPGGSARRTTSLPYRQGLVLGCLGFGARSYGLAKSMHPLYSR